MRAQTRTRSTSSTARPSRASCAISRASSTRENEEFWGVVGLLHDLDWEEHSDEPDKHTVYAAPLIEAAGGTPELVHAIQTHVCDFNSDLPRPESQMEKILFACEELTGLIGAAVVMRPSKSIMDFNVKSLKKKFKDKRFAAGVNRDIIREAPRCWAGSWTSCSPAPSRPCNPSRPTATRSARTRKARGLFGTRAPPGQE